MKTNVFGIRHLSPAGAWHVRAYLDQICPELVLIEGPSDFTEILEELGGSRIKPPVAVMAYTREAPIRTILYPFAEYSPEYQAILWAREHGCPCRFCDLPSEVFLGLDQKREQNGSAEKNTDGTIYERLNEASGEGSQETFWERTMEHSADCSGYQNGAREFGAFLRRLTGEQGFRTSEARQEEAEGLVREAYMRRVIHQAVEEGTSPERIVVVTGAYHVEGLLGEDSYLSDKEYLRLPRLEAQKTLMPYSYYRLSEHSGYGAGNQAPAYYELLWKGFCRGEADYAAERYLTGLSAFQRKQGGVVSSAEVIEAMRLASSLAELHDSRIPTLADLRDAAVTCMGHGRLSEIALAVADTEIGTKIGSLPKGVSQTSLQTDFYQKLEELRLEKYRTMTAVDLPLDLREKLTVKSKKAALLDLERSFFLHKLRVLGIPFAALSDSRQEKATWAENWVLRWTPEAEIQIVEAVLKGDTVEQAAGFELKDRLDKSRSLPEIAAVVEEACRCGMPKAVHMAVTALQQSAVEAASIRELADTAMSLSVVVRYGDIRHLDREPLLPLLSQLFLRSCLILTEECVCDDQAADSVASAVSSLNEVVVSHEFLEESRWLKVLSEIAARDDLNTRLSGLAAAILLERGSMAGEELGREVERRLSRGIPAELGVGWFEGLSMRNHYALIARLTLWEKLSGYLDTLSEEEFKRALVFLRRAFADFTAGEKDQIAENLGEIWQVNPSQVSELLNGGIPMEESGTSAAEPPLYGNGAAEALAGQGEVKPDTLLESLEEFDFDDI